MPAKQATASLLAAYLLVLTPLAAALQVTPDSPCSAFCQDDPNLDASDPESSNTFPEDITCRDGDFTSQAKGQKFQRCLTCLQESDYVLGHESDQQWFFYNLRYSFDYCVLGFPNATDVESSPCVTSEACGRIEGALKDGIVDPAYAEPYGYCAVDSGVLASEAVDNCLSCVRAGSGHHYLANFLTAVQAGCQQQPKDGITVGLSDTVFTDDRIAITLPSSSSGTSSDDSKSSPLSTPVIVGIAVGATALVLIAAGCVYMQLRKRRNRAAREARRASPLSFRCQTHLTPMTATFPPAVDVQEEKAFVDPAAALSSNPVAKAEALRSHAGLHSITTSIPRPPTAAVTTPHGSSPRIHSPDDYYQTPTSTTSNAPLLSSFRPYVPAEYGHSSPIIPGIAVSTPEETSPPALSPQQRHLSPKIGGMSPRIEQKGWHNRPSQNAWTPQDPKAVEIVARDLARGKRVVSGSPTSATLIQTSFPPPPPPKR